VSGVLLTDDCAIFRKTMRSLLASRFPSVRIEEAADAKEACGKIDDCLPDLIFMDIRLPDKSGLLLAREIKQLHPGMFIVMLSGYSSPEAQEVALKNGASFFLSKGSAKSSDIVEIAESILFPKAKAFQAEAG
jgi:DNA-binding NarL/FixJ family response regulator